MIKIKQKLKNILTKLMPEKFSEPTTGPQEENGNKDFIRIMVIMLVVGVISFMLDVFKFTPIYENNVMKKIINVNNGINIFVGSGLKIFGIVMLTKLIINELFIINTDETKGELNFEPDYSILNILFPIFILLTSFIFDIIQLTPLMQNKYINQFATFNSNASLMGIMICKILFPMIMISD